MVLSFGSPLSMWLASGWNGGIRDFMPTTVSFTGYTGPSWYSDTSGITIDQEGRSLFAEGALWWSGSIDIHFKSLTIAADLSSLNGRDLTSGTFLPDGGVGIKFQNILAVGTRSDPGTAVSIIPTAVPIPAAVWLFTSGLGLAAFTNSRKSQGNHLYLL